MPWDHQSPSTPKMPVSIAWSDKQVRIKGQSSKNHDLLSGILQTFKRVRLNYSPLQSKPTKHDAKGKLPSRHKTNSPCNTKCKSPSDPDLFWNTTHALETLTPSSDGSKLLSYFFCLPRMCWWFLPPHLCPIHLSHGHFHGHISAQCAIPCFSKDPQLISALSARRTPTFPASSLLCFYWYLHPELLMDYFVLCASCKWKQQMTLLLGQTSSRLSRMPGIMPRVDLNKKIKKDLVPAAMMIYGSFRSVSNGVPFWL